MPLINSPAKNSPAKTLLPFTIIFLALAPIAHAGDAGSPDLDALRLLAPASALGVPPQETSGALAANLKATQEIQNGNARQPLLQDFKDQQQQALRDAFITKDNAVEFADGLGSELGGLYQSAAKYTSTDDGRTASGINISPALATLFYVANGEENKASATAKYFFADGKADKKACLWSTAHEVLDRVHGKIDVFGTAYNNDPVTKECTDIADKKFDSDPTACTKSFDKYGNSRPFQTEPGLAIYLGKDYFGVPVSNLSFLCGPQQPLQTSPSFPSGHTTFGYTESVLLGILVPARYPQMIVRAAEYGNDRVILGAHYTMDVLAGRTLALYEVARLLHPRTGAGAVSSKAPANSSNADFASVLAQARKDLTEFFLRECAEKTLSACAAQDHSRFANADKDEAFYNATQTYGLPVVWPATTNGPEDVSKLTPNPGYLLTIAYPKLTLEQADRILTETEGPGGGFLDDGNPLGVYSRLDLYHATQKALALEAADEKLTH
jgi:hypothetical protein